MSFVGVVANNRDFKAIKKAFSVNIPKQISLIEINENNIENVRNIYFETLVFCRKLECSKVQASYLNNICQKASYLILNNDFSLYIPPSLNNECTFITFGLDQKSTVTVSSISENGFVISLQNNIVKHSGKIHEIEEKSVRTKNTNNFKLYQTLTKYILEIIYK